MNIFSFISLHVTKKLCFSKIYRPYLGSSLNNICIVTQYWEEFLFKAEQKKNKVTTNRYVR